MYLPCCFVAGARLRPTLLCTHDCTKVAQVWSPTLLKVRYHPYCGRGKQPAADKFPDTCTSSNGCSSTGVTPVPAHAGANESQEVPHVAVGKQMGDKATQLVCSCAMHGNCARTWSLPAARAVLLPGAYATSPVHLLTRPPSPRMRLWPLPST
jgi:hypothetical protein